MYGAGMVVLTKRPAAELEMELKMIRFGLGVTRMYRIRN